MSKPKLCPERARVGLPTDPHQIDANLRRAEDRERERANHAPVGLFVVGAKLGQSYAAQRAELQREQD